MKDLLAWSEMTLYGNSLIDWAIALGVALLTLLALLVVRRFVVARHTRYTEAGHSAAIRLVAHLAGTTRPFFLIPFAFYVGERWLSLSARVEHMSAYVMLLLVLAQVGIWATRTVSFLIDERAARESGQPGDAGIGSSLAIIEFGGRIIVWSIILLVALDNLGVNITALLAGLGVGGVAVALALQNILGDLFASLSIALDKPFVIGDILEIGEYSGTVEQIGIKSLRLRSGSGEQIILSNADALKSRIRNFGRAMERQAVFRLRILQETEAAKLALIPKLVEAAVSAQSGARFDRCHLREIGEHAFLYEVSMYSQGSTALVLYDRQHAVYLAIIEAFRAHGIAFAYPTQRVLSVAP
ncbi:MAG TPA: mechanosensitive ion channel family protein [Steroidobacteraceae bacterium]|nr:mechanosensitive ion channel family protein [Steroidobacteraceae bacterium]